MATVINNPDTGVRDSGSGLGVVLGVLIAIVVIVLLIVFAVPAIRGSRSGGTNINVPDKVQLDVNSGGQQGNPVTQ
jgi:hypothetical protein